MFLLKSLCSHARSVLPLINNGLNGLAICRTIELDEKFCDVIVNRYIEQAGTADGVSVLRDAKTYSYGEVADGTE